MESPWTECLCVCLLAKYAFFQNQPLHLSVHLKYSLWFTGHLSFEQAYSKCRYAHTKIEQGSYKFCLVSCVLLDVMLNNTQSCAKESVNLLCSADRSDPIRGSVMRGKHPYVSLWNRLLCSLMLIGRQLFWQWISAFTKIFLRRWKVLGSLQGLHFFSYSQKLYNINNHVLIILADEISLCQQNNLVD